jgi:hypothetical protein
MLLVWFLMISVAHDWVYGFHGKLFSVSVEKFDEINYRAMITYKVGVFIFNFVPYLALRIIG